MNIYTDNEGDTLTNKKRSKRISQYSRDQSKKYFDE